MNKVVYKLQLPEPGQIFDARLSRVVGFLHVGLQMGKPCLWFEVDPETKETVEYMITCVGTGWAFEGERCFHIGTIVTDSGFVWHYYAHIVQ